MLIKMQICHLVCDLFKRISNYNVIVRLKNPQSHYFLEEIKNGEKH